MFSFLDQCSILSVEILVYCNFQDTLNQHNQESKSLQCLLFLYTVNNFFSFLLAGTCFLCTRMMRFCLPWMIVVRSHKALLSSALLLVTHFNLRDKPVDQIFTSNNRLHSLILYNVMIKKS